MSNYNLQLQSNNMDLQTVLQTLQTKTAGEQVEWSANEDAIITDALNSYSNNRVSSIGKGAFAYASIQSVSFPNATTIGNYAFTKCTRLTTVSFPNATTIGSYAFSGCTSLKAISFPACTSIGFSAFHSCSCLITISFPAATTINTGAFINCSNLTTVNFPVVTTIGGYAFQYCEDLTTVSFPVATTIGSYAFYYCQNLTTVNIPNAKSINNSAFYGCSNLTTVNFPVVTTIDNSAFYDCSNLTTVNFPVATTIGSYAFGGCSSLTTVNFPVVTTIGSHAFQYCEDLAAANFPTAKSIVGSSAFAYCHKLQSLYITGSSLCKLSNSNAFKSTPIGGYSASAGTYGSIYVPASLLTSYQTATNWTYFSSRFVAFEEQPSTFQFTIYDMDYKTALETYNAEEGMTWREWVNSDYNTNGYYINDIDEITKGVTDVYGNTLVIARLFLDDDPNDIWGAAGGNEYSDSVIEQLPTNELYALSTTDDWG